MLVLFPQQRRHVQTAHEMKRREKEFERLQEKLRDYLAEKKREAKATLDMAGRLRQQMGSSVTRVSSKSDEGLKVTV